MNRIFVFLLLPWAVTFAYGQDLQALNCATAIHCVELGMTHYKANEPDKALPFFKAACDAKQGQGCLNVAVSYLKGQGTEKNRPSGYQFMRLACLYGQSNACKQAGLDHFNGNQVEKNFALALEHFEKGCALNEPVSCLYGGILRVDPALEFGQPQIGIGYLDKSCKLKLGNACEMLARVYYTGQGVPVDTERGVGLFAQACDLNNALGCEKGGRFFVKGQGVSKNVARGLELLKKGCQLKSEPSCALFNETTRPAASPSRSFNLNVASLTVDGLSARDLNCQLAKPNLFSSALILGSLSKQKSALDACAKRTSYSPRVSMRFTGTSTTDVGVEGVPADVAQCLVPAITQVQSTVSGLCEVTIDIGP